MFSTVLKMPNFASIAKAGVAGCCSIYLIGFGLMLLIPGIIMIQEKADDDHVYDAFKSDFFKDHIERQKEMNESFAR